MDDSDERTVPPPRPPVVLAGAEGDAKLRFAAALSREEVLRRRRSRLMQLYSLYRSQFWALTDELIAKHGKYWWDYGVSPVVELPRPALLSPLENGGGDAASITHGATGGTVAFSASNCVPPPTSENGGGGVRGAAVTPAAAGGRAACSAANCRAKAMPLTPYCFDHILLDPKQQLYKPCTFVTKQRQVSKLSAVGLGLMCAAEWILEMGVRIFHTACEQIKSLPIFFPRNDPLRKADRTRLRFHMFLVELCVLSGFNKCAYHVGQFQIPAPGPFLC